MSNNMMAFLNRVNSDTQLQDEINFVISKKGKIEETDIENIAHAYGYELKPEACYIDNLVPIGIKMGKAC